MRGSNTMGYECDDSLTPALSRRERGSSGLFQQPASVLSHKFIELNSAPVVSPVVQTTPGERDERSTESTIGTQ